ncbi:MAG: hypothetical protein MJ033_07675 [Victivallaceae bacterium]|nr:hypothetical protein [Victivallaceae bacterium]
MNRKKLVIGVIFLLIAIGITVGGFYLYQKNSPTSQRISHLSPSFSTPSFTSEILPNDSVNDSVNVKDLQSTLSELEKENLFKAAYQHLRKSIALFTLSDFRNMVNFYSDQEKILSEKNSKKQCSCFVFPRQYRDSSMRERLSYSVDDFVQPEYQRVQYLTTYQRQILDEKIGDIDIPSDIIIEKTIAHYGYVRDCVRLLDASLLTRYSPDDPSFIEISKAIGDLKKSLLKEFSDFISFTILSPYMWRASKKLTIINTKVAKWFKNRDKSIEQMSRMLAKMGHKNWLKWANYDVQCQFVNLQSDIKNTLNKSEYDKLRILTTLADSLDESKKNGGLEMWWKESVSQ